MTCYTLDELTGLDLDWFALDSMGHVGHFASNGTDLVPLAVIQRKKENELLGDYFYSLPHSKGAFSTPSSDSNGWRQLLSKDNEVRYIAGFAEWAERGLFSYDCKRDKGDVFGPYFLIAVPSSPLSVGDLPHHIRRYVSVTRFPFAFPVRIQANEVASVSPQV